MWRWDLATAAAAAAAATARTRARGGIRAAAPWAAGSAATSIPCIAIAPGWGLLTVRERVLGDVVCYAPRLSLGCATGAEAEKLEEEASFPDRELREVLEGEPVAADPLDRRALPARADER